MFKPDIIVAWPRHCDYPLWRAFIHKNRHRFNEVIIVFTETYQKLDFRDFIRKKMERDYVRFVEFPRSALAKKDWRDVAVNQALIHSYNADWIWFTEQDFLPNDTGFFFNEVTRAYRKGFTTIAAYNDKRMHPCCIFIKREVLNQTRKDFGIIVDRADHFSKIQTDLERKCVKDIWVLNTSLYTHLNGLSQNMTMIQNGDTPNWNVAELKIYLRKSLSVTVGLHPEWQRIYSDFVS